MKFKEYPKMIYKGGVPSAEKCDYCVVQDYQQEMEKLEEWGDKRPDDIEKEVKKVKIQIEPVIVNPEPESGVKIGRKKKSK